MQSHRKSWADRVGIPTGVIGETINGIRICEKNRATVWEFRKEGIQQLQDFMNKQYRDKGIRCTLFGVHNGDGELRYAVFVQSGFLRPVDEDE